MHCSSHERALSLHTDKKNIFAGVVPSHERVSGTSMLVTCLTTAQNAVGAFAFAQGAQVMRGACDRSSILLSGDVSDVVR